jgi:ubiquitin-conjugating enzyme E2 D/E
MSRLWTTRLQKELEGLWADPPEWCVPGADATDLFHWQVIVVGPRGSPYDGGVFAVRFKFPRHYPLKPPKVTFATKVRMHAPHAHCSDPISGRLASSLQFLVHACMSLASLCGFRCTTRTSIRGLDGFAWTS